MPDCKCKCGRDKSGKKACCGGCKKVSKALRKGKATRAFRFVAPHLAESRDGFRVFFSSETKSPPSTPPALG